MRQKYVKFENSPHPFITTPLFEVKLEKCHQLTLIPTPRLFVTAQELTIVMTPTKSSKHLSI